MFWGKAIDAVADVVGEFIEDKDQKAQLRATLEAQFNKNETLVKLKEMDLVKGQLKINEAEAKHNGFFTKWRSGAGWVCVIGLAWNFTVRPITLATLGILDPFVAADLSMIEIVKLDLAELMPLLFGLLGLGSLRSWEKSKGIERNK